LLLTSAKNRCDDPNVIKELELAKKEFFWSTPSKLEEGIQVEHKTICVKQMGDPVYDPAKRENEDYAIRCQWTRWKKYWWSMWKNSEWNCRIEERYSHGVFRLINKNPKQFQQWTEILQFRRSGTGEWFMVDFKDDKRFLTMDYEKHASIPESSKPDLFAEGLPIEYVNLDDAAVSWLQVLEKDGETFVQNSLGKFVIRIVQIDGQWFVLKTNHKDKKYEYYIDKFNPAPFYEVDEPKEITYNDNEWKYA